MNIREQRFVAAYLENGGNGTEAAKAAGYSPKTAYSQAWRLLKRAEVAAAVQSGQTVAINRAAKAASVTKAHVLKQLASDRKGARKAEQWGAAIRADELQGRELGMFAERHVLALEDDRRRLLAAVEPEGPGVYQRVLERLAAGVVKALPGAEE